MLRLFKITLLVTLLLSMIVTVDAWRILHTPMNITESSDFEFAVGASGSTLVKQLVQRDWIKNSAYLSSWIRLSGSAHKLKAGEYVIEPDTTPLQLLEQMKQGKVKLYTVTLIEGKNFRDFLLRLSASPNIKQTLQNKSIAEIMEALGHTDENPEGLFFPDTYSFPNGMDDVKILQRAYAAMQRKLNAAWDTREPNLPFATPYEALIMASIVEKETALASERTQIAGVFINRLRIGMRLQTDPTVIYGMGPSFNGNIRVKDLQQDTPYNTYTRKGLPPTPIAMPSAEAIDAVMHPESTPFIFFVARGDASGSHVFSVTHDDHEAAVDKYQRKKKRK